MYLPMIGVISIKNIGKMLFKNKYIKNILLIK